VRARLVAAATLGLATAAAAQDVDSVARAGFACPSCAEWNAPQQGVRIFGNAYWVGPRGLGAILITGPSGHVLIDGGLPESATLIAANVEALGFRVTDIRLLLNSHAHYDHAGGLAELARRSGATVAATAWSAQMIEQGVSQLGDPQFGVGPGIPRVERVRVVEDGETLAIGPLRVTAHLTAGHTPGGTSWSWESCEAERCLGLVYADSQTPISADGFLFTASESYPTALADFERGHARLRQLRCDILITTHPGASNWWERVERRERGEPDGLIDPTACERYARRSAESLARRVRQERAGN